MTYRRVITRPARRPVPLTAEQAADFADCACPHGPPAPARAIHPAGTCRDTRPDPVVVTGA